MEFDRRNFLTVGVPALAALVSGCARSPNTSVSKEGPRTDKIIREMFGGSVQLIHRPDGMPVLRVTAPGEYNVQSLYENKYIIQGRGEWKFTVKEASLEKPFDCEMPDLKMTHGYCTQVVRYVAEHGLQIERYGIEQRRSLHNKKM